MATKPTGNPAGRPPREDAHATARLTVRLTPAQHTEAKRRAAAAGLPLAVWAARQIVWPVIVITSDA